MGREGGPLAYTEEVAGSTPASPTNEIKVSVVFLAFQCLPPLRIYRADQTVIPASTKIVAPVIRFASTSQGLQVLPNRDAPQAKRTPVRLRGAGGTTMSAGLQFDEETSRRVEAIYSTPDVVAQRKAVLEALELRPGERVLDVGSGPGFLAADMAVAVGDSGRVRGIDISEGMVAISQRRCVNLTHVVFKSALRRGCHFRKAALMSLSRPKCMSISVISTCPQRCRNCTASSAPEDGP